MGSERSLSSLVSGVELHIPRFGPQSLVIGGSCRPVVVGIWGFVLSVSPFRFAQDPGHSILDSQLRSLFVDLPL